MVKLKLIAAKKVHASSIMEVVVAMIVMLVVFGLALTIFSNVSRSTLSQKKVKAEALLHDLMTQAELQHDFATRSFMSGNWRIDESITPYPADAGLNEFTITVFDDNEVQIATLKKIIDAGHE